MQTFPIAPVNMRAIWLLLPVVAIPLTIGVLVVIASLNGMRAARFEVSGEGLRLKGDFYGRAISASDLRGGSARRIDLRSNSDLRPVRRTMGTGLPGYRAGWFLLGGVEFV